MSTFKDTLQIAVNNGILLDGCGSDERIRYNGLYTDLCGMSIEEYMKPHCPCNCNGGSDTGTTKANLVLTLTYESSSDGKFYPVISTGNKSMSADANVELVINGETIKMTIAKGSTSVKSEQGFDEMLSATKFIVSNETELKEYYKTITVVNYIPKEASKYIYTSVINQDIFDKEVTDISKFNLNITSENTFEIKEETELKVYIPKWSVEEPETDDEYNAWLKENAYALLIFIPQDIEIKDLTETGISTLEYFKKIGEQSISNVDYNIYGKIISEEEKNNEEPIVNIGNSIELRGYAAESEKYNFSYTLTKK